MSRRFLVEAEELAARVPDVLYHAGEPALWALVLLEAGKCPARQASVLRRRLADRESGPLQQFSTHLENCFIKQESALKDAQSFLMLREDALRSIAAANALADMICAQSEFYEERRNEQARALRGLFDMKELVDD